jgi:hypothetical protein
MPRCVVLVHGPTLQAPLCSPACTAMRPPTYAHSATGVISEHLPTPSRVPELRPSLRPSPLPLSSACLDRSAFAANGTTRLSRAHRRSTLRRPRHSHIQAAKRRHARAQGWNPTKASIPLRSIPAKASFPLSPVSFAPFPVAGSLSATAIPT